MNRIIFEKLVTSRFNAKEHERIMLAYKLSKYGHDKQKRDNGERYFNHPRRVAIIIMTESNIPNDVNLTIEALVHDLPEDSFILSETDIALIFGDQVGKITGLLTKKKGEDTKYYFERLLNGPQDAKIVKLADRLDNLRDMINVWDKKRIMKYVKETTDFILPLANSDSSLLKEKINNQIAQVYTPSLS